MPVLNYAIHCTDAVSGKVGCFGFDTEEYLSADKSLQFKARTPVFNGLIELFTWARNNNVELVMRPVSWALNGRAEERNR